MTECREQKLLFQAHGSRTVTAAYVVLNAVRRTALAGTELARAYCGTIRLALFKIGGVVRVSVRRLTVALSSAYPRAALFGRVLQRLQAVPA
jgi:hypothetical protein